MLSQTMVEQLNAQINLEFFSSNLYLQMSAWCEDKGFDGAAQFLRVHAVEEMQHMQRLFTYVSETGALPILGAIAAPKHDFASLGEVFRETYEHEQMITQQINKLAHGAFTSRIIQRLTSCSGMSQSSTKKKNCSKGFWTKLNLLVKMVKLCSSSIKIWHKWRKKVHLQSWMLQLLNGTASFR